jgi:Putative transposase, YhgA-like
LTTFELDNTNYVNKDFEEYYSDVVYRTSLKSNPEDKKKKKVAVALLYEHKKTIISYFSLFLQLLEYIIFIWRTDLSNKRKPSIIIPIVVFQGKKGLRVKELHQCFKGIPQELLKYIPNFHYHLTNVHNLANDTLLALKEKNLLRSLLLAYVCSEKNGRIENMNKEIFEFLENNSDKLAVFKILHTFLRKEDFLNINEASELFKNYLSLEQTECVCATYQYLKEEAMSEGKQEAEQEKARLTVLRGKWNKLPAEALADSAELPLAEVNNLLKAYDKVHELWLKNKGMAMETVPEIEHLSKQEVRYLLTFFTQKYQAAAEN